MQFVASRIKEIQFVKSAEVMGKLETWPEIVISEETCFKTSISSPVFEGSYLLSSGKVQ